MSRLIGPLRTVVEGVFPWSMYRVQAGTAFLDAFAMLLSAGLQPLDAVRELERSASPYFRWRLSKIRQHLRQAVPVGRGFAEAGRWPHPSTPQDRKGVGEGSGVSVIVDPVGR